MSINTAGPWFLGTRSLTRPVVQEGEETGKGRDRQLPGCPHWSRWKARVEILRLLDKLTPRVPCAPPWVIPGPPGAVRCGSIHSPQPGAPPEPLSCRRSTHPWYSEAFSEVHMSPEATPRSEFGPGTLFGRRLQEAWCKSDSEMEEKEAQDAEVHDEQVTTAGTRRLWHTV